MSDYYTPKRTRNIYNPHSGKPYALSRSKIDLYRECPRCFYLDRRLGVGRPPGYPFSLNSAVDTLLKQEFDIHRKRGTRHPLMESYGVNAVPVYHAELDDWRKNFVGVRVLHRKTQFIVTGAIDDLWQGEDESYIVVDYKATSKIGSITKLDQDWHDGYKRQMEVYQWLLRQKGYAVSNTGYFVYCNGRADKKAFDARLEFDITLIPYTGSDSWVEPTLWAIRECLETDIIPDASKNCDYCAYRTAANTVDPDL